MLQQPANQQSIWIAVLQQTSLMRQSQRPLRLHLPPIIRMLQQPATQQPIWIAVLQQTGLKRSSQSPLCSHLPPSHLDAPAANLDCHPPAHRPQESIPTPAVTLPSSHHSDASAANSNCHPPADQPEEVIPTPRCASIFTTSFGYFGSQLQSPSSSRPASRFVVTRGGITIIFLSASQPSPSQKATSTHQG
ncbi:hypothetical protein PtB15_14B336 [Puccinia triticina]|nr:hypothetical protein PtB15_14B336 [Puccinia triticina]